MCVTNSPRLYVDVDLISANPCLDYQLLRLGRAGYTAIMTNASYSIISFPFKCTNFLTQLTSTADFLAQEIVNLDHGERFELLSEINGAGLPLVAWRLKKEGKYDGMCDSCLQMSTVVSI
jgi:hypothetical protein